MIKKILFLIIIFVFNSINSFSYDHQTWNILNVVDVKISAYSSSVIECDDTPFLAAWNNKLNPEIDYNKIIAISRDLLKNYDHIDNDKEVFLIFDNKILRVEIKDKMNKRFKKRVDLYFGVDRQKALEFGIKKGKIVWFD